jgi:hypothetical protein
LYFTSSMKNFFLILPVSLFVILMLPYSALKCLGYLHPVTCKQHTKTSPHLVSRGFFLPPDISLGSDITGNLFTTFSSAHTIVYNISEIGGTAAVGDTLRITRVAGYNLSFNFATYSAVVGGTTYILDNFRWKIDNSNSAFFSLILTDQSNALNPGTINANQQIYLSVVLTRFTADISSFTLSARLRNANGELNLTNNLNSIAFSAE